MNKIIWERSHVLDLIMTKGNRTYRAKGANVDILHTTDIYGNVVVKGTMGYIGEDTETYYEVVCIRELADIDDGEDKCTVIHLQRVDGDGEVISDIEPIWVEYWQFLTI